MPLSHVVRKRLRDGPAWRFRFFLWIVPLGLVVAATPSFWVELDPAGLENASREFGVGAAAAESAVKALEPD